MLKIAHKGNAILAVNKEYLANNYEFMSFTVLFWGSSLV